MLTWWWQWNIVERAFFLAEQLEPSFHGSLDEFGCPEGESTHEIILGSDIVVPHTNQQSLIFILRCQRKRECLIPFGIEIVLLHQSLLLAVGLDSIGRNEFNLNIRIGQSIGIHDGQITSLFDETRHKHLTFRFVFLDFDSQLDAATLLHGIASTQIWHILLASKMCVELALLTL